MRQRDHHPVMLRLELSRVPHTSFPPDLSLRFARLLDAASVLRFRHRLHRAGPADTFLGDLSQVETIDPEAAALLLLVCREAAETLGMRVTLIGLTAQLRSALRRHPLLGYCDDEGRLFTDPDRVPVASQR